MNAASLVSNVIPKIKTSDTGAQALQLMEDFKISHLPIVNRKDFLGLLTESDIYDHEDQINEVIGNYQLSLFSPFVLEDQHLYEVIALASRLSLSIIPVLNSSKHYVGCISISELIPHISELMAAEETGTILVLEMLQIDYSLSHLSRIIESDDVKIVSMYVHNNPESNKINITIKLNTINSTPVIKSLERFNYQIVKIYNEDQEFNDLLEQRYAEFMKYLNM